MPPDGVLPVITPGMLPAQSVVSAGAVIMLLEIAAGADTAMGALVEAGKQVPELATRR